MRTCFDACCLCGKNIYHKQVSAWRGNDGGVLPINYGEYWIFVCWCAALPMHMQIIRRNETKREYANFRSRCGACVMAYRLPRVPPFTRWRWRRRRRRSIVNVFVVCYYVVVRLNACLVDLICQQLSNKHTHNTDKSMVLRAWICIDICGRALCIADNVQSIHTAYVGCNMIKYWSVST